jgi:hypothetical protein
MQRLIKTSRKRWLIRVQRAMSLFSPGHPAYNQGRNEPPRALPGRVCPIVCSAGRQLKRFFVFSILFARHLLIASFMALSPSR